MKHTLIIEQVNGRIVNIAASGETQIVLIEKTVQMNSISLAEPDFEFEIGKAHEMYEEDVKEFLKKHKI